MNWISSRATAKPTAYLQAEKRWQGVDPIATGLTFEEFRRGHKAGQFPTYSIFSAILGNVYAPQPTTGDL